MAKRKKNVADQVLDAVKGRGRGTPRLEELVQHFFDVAGGPRSVATLMYEEYLAAPVGSQARSRILATLAQCMKFVTARNDLRGDDISLLSEEDLTREIEELVDGEGEAEAQDERGDRGPEPAAPGEAAQGPADAATAAAGHPGAAAGAAAGADGAPPA